MKKKWLVLVTGVGVGSAMLLLSGFSASAGNSGYEAYKAAWKNMRAVSSVSGDVAVSVTDRSDSILKVNTAFKADHKRHAASAVVRIDDGGGNGAKQLNVYRQEDQTVIKPADNETYKVIEGAGPGWNHEAGGHMHPAAISGAAENVIDAMMGSLKNQVALEEETNGGKHVSLHLSGSRIPAVLNAIGSAIVSKAANHEHDLQDRQNGKGGVPFPDLNVRMPQLTDDIRVQEIKLDAYIDKAQYIDGQSAEIKISGKDSKGAAHEITVKLDLDLSGVNNSVPDTVDLTGKNVEIIRHEPWKRNGPHWQ